VIPELGPYPEYKDSGVAWLGAVPAHWEVLRIKALFREKEERSGSSGGVLLSLTRARGIVPQAEASSRIASAEDLSKYKICGPGDLVMNRMQAWSGMFARSQYTGVVSPDYSVFRAVGAAEVKFFEHLFKASILVDQFAQRSKGIGTGFNRLYTPDFGAIPAIVPPLFEQSAIVRFLDHADRRIQRYIRAKKKLIALLNEQKQAIIHRAVTRGLDPDVRLKPSGVEWLGEIPAHWGVSRLKHIASHLVDCLHATPQYSEDGEYPAIRTADVEPGKVRLASSRKVNFEQYNLWTMRLKPEEGDILYSREGERFGIAAPVPAGVSLCISQRMMVFRIRPTQSSSFIMWQLNANHVYAQAAADVIGAAAPHVNIERIRNFWIVVPPFGEQELIAADVAAKSVDLEIAVERVRRELHLLREYRTRLIADVVTGKLDVREAAARLPDEPEEAAPFEEDEEVAADGEEDAMEEREEVVA
jgi:type I restriction enzyme, S subunit